MVSWSDFFISLQMRFIFAVSNKNRLLFYFSKKSWKLFLFDLTLNLFNWMAVEKNSVFFDYKKFFCLTFEWIKMLKFR